ncbi:hypothetical protein [Pseudomonas rubra]|uniref:Uncharacterized protein n=1 Tax=Pseudomonas rubra TaxID=2942627 RepID=A0ABT5PEW6_9PSED|nr:hypothetical protein [Pseudomonas rubra]MDD1016858.1 hypothetical protein [Pseudomonas rubra]MDD1039396.1 hypothetical protein [Pseudomonas rubra]MDD1157822.1 hypothetical protein [Pseudomonas rubra]
MAVREPTDKDLQQSLWLSWVIVGLAIVIPIMALSIPFPRFDGLDRAGWFSRSGSVTTVFAILAEVILIRAKLSITPLGFGWEGLQEQRDKFIPKFEGPELLILILTVFGTLVWGYGDLLYKWSITFVAAVGPVVEGHELEKLKISATTVVWVCSVVSAITWAKSAAANVPAKLPGSQLIFQNEDGSQTDLIATAKLQGKWNKIAALFASIAALAQAISVFLN